MGIWEALFKIREFLESHGADEDVIRAWETLRDDITKIISEMMMIHL